MLFAGIHYGTRSAGDSDPYGYVSQADLIAHGAFSVDQQVARTMPWPLAESTFAPKGYIPAPTRGFIVPTYPAGLPLLMAIAERLASRSAVFLVVPLLGALTVWMTARLGASLHSPAAGALAALLVAASPMFLRQVVQPVSDVPAGAWWAAALALVVDGGAPGVFVGGLATAMAIVTRPNLAPLAIVIAIGARAASGGAERRSWERAALFGGGVLPGVLAVLWIDRHLYGSAFRSGYGPLDAIYALGHVLPNLNRYPRWLLAGETPFVVLGLAAPWVVSRGEKRRVWLLLAFAGAVVASYLFYRPFGRDESAYLRFLLPAYPPLMVLSVAVLLEALNRTPTARQYELVALAICGGLAIWQVSRARDGGVFDLASVDQRYIDVGRYVAVATPPESVFLSGEHAGSIRYYSGRLTLRYDLLEPGWLDTAVETLRVRGYHPYFALEEGEEDAFRERFAGRSALSGLDWPPAAARVDPIKVRIYDPADRVRHLAGEPVVTAAIPRARTR